MPSVEYIAYMRNRSSNQQKDTQQLARNVLDAIAPDAEPVADDAASKEKTKNPAAVALGRLGGLKGGRARADRLTKERRSEIAKKAALKRWSKRKDAM